MKLIVLCTASRYKRAILQIVENSVDIYFVMDLTKTMQKGKDQLQTAATQITEQIKNLTKSFRVGLGGFIEKAMAPYEQLEFGYCTDENTCPLINCGVFCGFDRNKNNYHRNGYYKKRMKTSCEHCNSCEYDCEDVSGTCEKSK